jgi:outer membrane protein assembly factor BamB
MAPRHRSGELMVSRWDRMLALVTSVCVVGALGVSAAMAATGVLPPVATATALGASSRSVAFDAPLTLSATVTASGSIPTGSVSFVDQTEAVTFAHVALTAGRAQSTIAALLAETHHLVAVYEPTGAFAASTSTPAVVSVAAATDTYATTVQQDARHDGDAAGVAITAKLHRAWTVNFAANWSYPVIANNRIFDTATSSSGSSSLYALDRASGSVVWGPVSLGAATSTATLAYDGMHIFVLAAERVGLGVLSSYDSATGTLVWSEVLPLQWWFTGPLTARDGVVYLTGDGVGGNLYAVSEFDGALLWTANILGGASAVTVDTSGVYDVGRCQYTQAFTPSGVQRWWYDGFCGEGSGGTTGALHNGKLYARDVGISTQAPVILDASSGTVLGNFVADITPAFDTNNGYYQSAGNLTAISSSGKTLWAFTHRNLTTSPVAANGLVFVAAAKGTLYALNVSTGAVAWSSKSAGTAAIAPDEGSNVAGATYLAVAEKTLVVPEGNLLSAFISK